MPKNDSAPRPKRERFNDPIYDLKKQVRAEQRFSKSQQGNQIDISTTLEKDQIKYQIILDKDLIVRKMNIGAEQAQMAINAIEAFNDRRVGQFTRKRQLSPNNKPRYTLRSGKLRILVEETENEFRTRKFEIIDIRSRKDVYRKNDM